MSYLVMTITKKNFWDFINQDRENVWQIKQDNPVDFLDKLVFREMPQYISAVGFKLFYYHAQKGKEQAVWDYLKDAKEIKIIHLKRKNILKTYVSQEIALKTDNWIAQGKLNKINHSSIYLDYNLVLKALKKLVKESKKQKNYLLNIKSLMLSTKILLMIMPKKQREFRIF